MTQLNQLLGEVKDLLRQQVTIGTYCRKAPVLSEKLCELLERQARSTAGGREAGRPAQPSALGLTQRLWKWGTGM